MFKIREARSNIGQFLCMLALSTASVAHGASSVGKLVVVGDSLSAGFQNFSLFDDTGATLYLPSPTPYVGGQKLGYAAQLAKQAGTDLNLPLISWPGVPIAIGSNPNPPLPGGRENVTQQTQTLDLSVPGYLVADALGRVVDTTTFNLPSVNVIDVMAFDVLAYPFVTNNNLLTSCGVVPLSTTSLLLSEAACAVQQQPDTLIVWIGNNDALQALTLAIQPTDPQIFAAQYDILLATLKASGAKMVVANVPDVTHLPFLIQCTSGPYNGDYFVPNLANPTGNPSQACSIGTGTGQFLEVDPSLVTQAHNAVIAYNSTISAEAQKFGATLVDVYSLFEKIHKTGGYTPKPGNAMTLGNGPGGGLFSLDLIHPTNTGYAILANTFISAMNKSIQPHNAQIPSICVNTVAKGQRGTNGDPIAPDLLVPDALRNALPWGPACLQ